MEAVQSTGKAIVFGKSSPAALEKKWVVAPEQVTSIDLDKVVKHKSDSDTSRQSNSSSSLLVADRDIVENVFRAVLDYHQDLVKDMLQANENTDISSLIVSTDSSTPILEYYSRYVDAQAVKIEVQRLFSLATFIDLEPGMANEFSEGLEEAIETFGEVALEQVQEFVLDEKIPFTIAAEALRYIGNIESGRYVDARRNMIESCLLNSKYMLVRDGAAAGLSYIDDSKSIPCLLRAIDRETHVELRKDLVEVLELLQDTSAE